jgi:hypothetical protein
MGAVCCISKRNRRERPATSRQTTECEIARTRRRWLGCIGDVGFCMRRHSLVLQPSETWRKTGIALRIKEWYALRDHLAQIHNNHPILSSTPTCNDHYNQEGAYACRECNTFHWFEITLLLSRFNNGPTPNRPMVMISSIIKHI